MTPGGSRLLCAAALAVVAFSGCSSPARATPEPEATVTITLAPSATPSETLPQVTFAPGEARTAGLAEGGAPVVPAPAPADAVPAPATSARPSPSRSSAAPSSTARPTATASTKTATKTPAALCVSSQQAAKAITTLGYGVDGVTAISCFGTDWAYVEFDMPSGGSIRGAEAYLQRQGGTWVALAAGAHGGDFIALSRNPPADMPAGLLTLLRRWGG